MMARAKQTPKNFVRSLYPEAVVDFSEVFRCARKPCWFIRKSLQGGWPHTGFYPSESAAWKAAWAVISGLDGKAGA